jgi:hypothetical protein
MARSYSGLKAELGIVDHPFLEAFERYIEAMRFNTRVLEWSCKLTPDHLESARFLHTARHPEFVKARSAVARLIEFLDRSSDGLLRDSFFVQLPALAERVGQGVAVGYAASHDAQRRGAELKLYIATSRVAEVRNVIEQLLPNSGVCPPSTRRVMIAASMDDEFSCGSRVYYLWDRGILDLPDVREWLRAWCTAEELDLIESSATATLSIAFKRAERDMIYISAPFAGSRLERFVMRRIERHPALVRELANLRWIGFSKRREGLNSRELNVYFSSALDEDRRTASQRPHTTGLGY